MQVLFTLIIVSFIAAVTGLMAIQSGRKSYLREQEKAPVENEELFNHLF